MGDNRTSSMVSTAVPLQAPPVGPDGKPLAWTPYTVICDTREQRPYTFAGPFKRQGKHYAVHTVSAALPSGDYSLLGFESRIAIERKSKQDLYSTIGQGRDRFHREIERLAVYDFAAIVVEAELSEVLADPPPRSQLPPTVIFHTASSWMIKYPRVHWLFVNGRPMGEVTTVRLLDWFHRVHAQEAIDRLKQNQR